MRAGDSFVNTSFNSIAVFCLNLFSLDSRPQMYYNRKFISDGDRHPETVPSGMNLEI